MARELTPEEELMDTNNDGKVSKKERRKFREKAPETVAQKWGVSYALITQLAQSSDPAARDFAAWFDGKVAEYFNNPIGFSDDAFILEFNQQPWAQEYKRAAIEDMDFEARFPKLYKDALEGDLATLRDQAAQYGALVSDDELMELAKQKRRFGLNSSQLRDSLATLATAKGGDFRGLAGTTQTNLREWSRRNGVALTENTINNYAQRVTAGDLTEDDVLQELRRTYLAGAYPGWADQIEAGQDIYDISAPYRGRMENLLELGSGTVTLDDPLLQSGLQSIGPDGKPRIKPIYEFEQDIRNDPRWPKTDNAYETYAESMTGLLKTFGFR